MISPPNQGSEVPDVLQEIELFKSLLGPAALQLGTGESSIPNSLLPIGGQIGVITGDSTSDPWQTIVPSTLAGVNFVLHAAGWLEGGLASISHSEL
ncbi:MAG: trimethylamine methyltransferase family protein [Gammaproteobacteria bacterium]